MPDEEKTGSGWTKPPKGKVKKPKSKANAHRRGNKHTIQRRQTAEKMFAELEAGAGIDKPPPEEPKLLDAHDYMFAGEPVPEMTPNEKRGCGGTYREEYARIARELCELGATDIVVARALGTSLSTMWGWQARHEEFFRAMIVGKGLPDEKVRRALYQRAVGYSYPKVEFKIIGGDVKALAKITHIPPDVAACNSWLRARDKEWNPATNVNLTSEESFRNLWTMVSQGQTIPVIEGSFTEIEDASAA